MHIDQGTQNLFKIIIKKLDNDCFVTTDHIFINLQKQTDFLIIKIYNAETFLVVLK